MKSKLYILFSFVIFVITLFSCSSPLEKEDGFNNLTPIPPVLDKVITADQVIVLNWEQVTGATEYEIFINTSIDRPNLPINTINKTNATINNLENKLSYYLWIKSKNKKGKSDYSVPIIGIPNPITPPENLTIRAGNEQLTINWNSIPNASEYEVFYNTNNIQPENPVVITTNTTAVIKGLVNYATYYIWVRAKNIAGVSLSSLITGSPVGPPAMPSGLTYSRSFTGAFTITVQCSPVLNATKYRWELSTRNNTVFSEKTTTVSSANFDYANDRISYNVDYLIRVRAENGAGTSDWSQRILILGWY